MPDMSICQILQRAADHALAVQGNDGAFPAGHNGPYHDPETPVRNTAHLLFLLASLHLRNPRAEYRRAGEAAADYLLSDRARPCGKTSHHRDKPGKDRCNGLIGQAWVIEALVQASKAFQRPDCYVAAEQLFLLHPWNASTALWQRVDVDGTLLPYDNTFNHQLWFAAAAAQLDSTPQAMTRAARFLERVARQVQTYPDGVIFHGSALGRLTDHLRNGPGEFVQQLRSRRSKGRQRAALYDKSAGYHAFNLYAYAMLRQALPDASIWGSELVPRLLAACDTPSYQAALERSAFGYRYNVTGIELAYACAVFGAGEARVRHWLMQQVRHTGAPDGQLLARDASDPNTAAARIYALARLEDWHALAVSV